MDQLIFMDQLMSGFRSLPKWARVLRLGPFIQVPVWPPQPSAVGELKGPWQGGAAVPRPCCQQVREAIAEGGMLLL